MPYVKLSSANQNLELYYEVHGTGKIKILFMSRSLYDCMKLFIQCEQKSRRIKSL